MTNFFWARREIFLDKTVTDDCDWSVDKLLAFSYLPGVNNALEGDTRIEVYRDHEDMESSQSDLEDLQEDAEISSSA